MFSFRSGCPIAVNHKGQRIYLTLGETPTDGFTSFDDSNMMLLPECRPNQVASILITGSKGSGKSTWAGRFVSLFKDQFQSQDDDIFLFRRQTQPDPVLDSVGLVQIPIDEGFVEDPISIEDLSLPDAHTMVIFDDVESVAEADRKKRLIQLRNSICQDGRKLNIHVINILHNMRGGPATVNVLMESDGIVVFPNSITDHIRTGLKEYFDFDKRMFQALQDWKGVSRWMYFNKEYPRYCIHEKGGFIID